jgi:hypothetical protein
MLLFLQERKDRIYIKRKYRKYIAAVEMGSWLYGRVKDRGGK